MLVVFYGVPGPSDGGNVPHLGRVRETGKTG